MLAMFVRIRKSDRQEYLRHGSGRRCWSIVRLRHEPPWGDEAQAHFVNACIEIETSLDPHALLFTLHKIERKFGRDRAHETRWGPRTLDLDLIAYDDISLDRPELTLPHPRLFERAFVLVPLVEIAPDRLIGGRSIKAALAGLSTEGIERLPDLG